LQSECPFQRYLSNKSRPTNEVADALSNQSANGQSMLDKPLPTQFRPANTVNFDLEPLAPSFPELWLSNNYG
jgi:pyrrolidone-carboxylate peptidase